MKARLSLAAAAVGVVALGGAATAAEPGECHEGANIQVHLNVNGEQTDICLPPEDGEAPGLPGAPELPPLELPQP